MPEWLRENLGVNRSVLALSTARFADGVGNSLLIIIIPLYVAALPAPLFPLPEPVLVGILISWFGLVNSSIQPLAGALSDTWQRRKPFILAGLGLLAASTLAFLLAGRYVDLILIRTFQGLGFALTIPASLALMAAATERSSRGSAMGVFTAFRMAGFAIGPLLGGFLYVRYGFVPAFWASAGCILLGLIAVQLWVEDPAAEASPLGGVAEAPANPVGAAEVDEVHANPAAAGEAREVHGNPGPPDIGDELAADEDAGFRVFDRSILTAGVLALGFAIFVLAADMSMMAALENEFNERLSQTALDFGIAFSALTLGRLVFQIPLGWLSDRIGRRPVIVAGLIALAPVTAILGFVVTTGQLTGARALQGIVSAAIAAPAFALLADVVKVGGEGRQMSILGMSFGMGIALGPLLGGVLVLLGFAVPFVVGGVLALGAAWVVYRVVPAV